MDGVLANFAYKFKEVAGLEPKEYIQTFGQEAFWRECDSVKFWSEMPMERNAPMLWRYLSDKNVTLLTTPSPQVSSRVGKILWKYKFLKGNPRIIFSSSKEDYADSRSILIDDFKQKTAYEIMPSLVGSEMCIRDRFYACYFFELVGEVG